MTISIHSRLTRRYRSRSTNARIYGLKMITNRYTRTKKLRRPISKKRKIIISNFCQTWMSRSSKKVQRERRSWWRKNFIFAGSNLDARCLKITEKVSFSIASEASYVYIWSGQKLIKNGSFSASFWKPEGCGQTVLPDRSISIGQKLLKNAKIKKNQLRYFE